MYIDIDHNETLSDHKIFCVLVLNVCLCSSGSRTRLRPLPVQTQGMQLLKVFIQLYYNNSHQQYENEVSHSSMFKISML